jgi:hypothetical protein
MMRRERTTFLLLFLLLAGSARAGSLVTFELRSAEGGTRRVRAEVLGFGDGRFRVRDPESGARSDVPLDAVIAVDFEGARRAETAPSTLPDLNAVLRMAGSRRYAALRTAFREAAAGGEREGVADLARRLAGAADATDVGSSKRLPMLAARWIALVELGETETAAAALRDLRAQFPEADLAGLIAVESRRPREQPKPRDDGAVDRTGRVRDDNVPRGEAPRERGAGEGE